MSRHWQRRWVLVAVLWVGTGGIWLNLFSHWTDRAAALASSTRDVDRRQRAVIQGEDRLAALAQYLAATEGQAPVAPLAVAQWQRSMQWLGEGAGVSAWSARLQLSAAAEIAGWQRIPLSLEASLDHGATLVVLLDKLSRLLGPQARIERCRFERREQRLDGVGLTMRCEFALWQSAVLP